MKTPCYYCDHAEVCFLRGDMETYISHLDLVEWIDVAIGCAYFADRDGTPVCSKTVFLVKEEAK